MMLLLGGVIIECGVNSSFGGFVEVTMVDLFVVSISRLRW